MLLNYHVLKRWTDEVRPVLEGAKVIELFSQQKDVLVVSTVNQAREQNSIEFCCVPKQGHVVLRTKYPKRKRNLATLFMQITGDRIAAFNLRSGDRVLEIRFSSGLQIFAELFGSMNIVLADNDGRLIDAFKDAKTLIGTTFETTRGRRSQVDLSSYESFLKIIPDAESLKTFVSGGGHHLSKPMAQEFLHRWTSDELKDGYDCLKKLNHEIYASPPGIYAQRGMARLLTPCRLSSIETKNPDWEFGAFHSMNDALTAYVRESRTAHETESMRHAVQKACRSRIKKNTALLRALGDELSSARTFEEAEKQAKLVAANIHAIHKGMSTVRLHDFYSEAGNEVDITLNVELTPAENVEALFNHAKKMKASVKKIDERIAVLRRETLELEEMQATCESLDSRALEKIYRKFTENKWIQKGGKRRTDDDAQFTFREYLLPENWRVFVGQNDIKNDLLTFRFAKADDYWFHARGVSGSHVVLKREGRKDNPSKIVLEQTASIAAFYSKARTSALVPVSWTFKKFVRKKKGARPGQVVIEREEVMVVPPSLPPE